MKPLRYVCPTSHKLIKASYDDYALWMSVDQAAHLFGIRTEKVAKLLRQLRTTREIDAACDFKAAGNSGLLLSHRAVVSLGYQTNFGRATVFRHWCASQLPVLLRDKNWLSSRSLELRAEDGIMPTQCQPGLTSSSLV